MEYGFVGYTFVGADVEISPNNRAKCKKCVENLEKGKYRVLVEVQNPVSGRTTIQYYDLRCYVKEHKEILSLDDIRYPNGFSKLPIMYQYKFTKRMFRYNFLKLSKLKLKKELSEMSVKELKVECKIRCLKYGGRRQYLEDRLEKFLNKNNCQKCYDIIVSRYCNESEREYKLRIPVYLAQIVRQYYPSVV